MYVWSGAQGPAAGVCTPPSRFYRSTRKRIDPFRTAVPVWGQTSQTVGTLSPERDCSPKRGNTSKYLGNRRPKYLIISRSNNKKIEVSRSTLMFQGCERRILPQCEYSTEAKAWRWVHGLCYLIEEERNEEEEERGGGCSRRRRAEQPVSWETLLKKGYPHSAVL